MKFVFFFTVFIFGQAALATDIHAWTDKNGHKHFSEKLPLGANDVKSSSAPEVKTVRTEESIRKAIELQKGKLFVKYRKALKNNPSLHGRLVVRLTVEPSGIVSQALLIKSELGDSELENEFISQFKSIDFGKENIKATSISYSMEFLPN
jgi:uncharacterized FlgJ-related protein